jgi:hypothetical protein
MYRDQNPNMLSQRRPRWNSGRNHAMPKNYRKSLRQTTCTRLKPFWKREKRDEEFSIWSSGSDIQSPSTAGSLNRTYKSEASRFEVSVLRMASSDTDSVSSWVTCGKKTPRSEVVFLCRVLILYTVIVVSIYNLTVQSQNSTLWTALLSSCLGYLLPSPTIKMKHVVPDSA